MAYFLYWTGTVGGDFLLILELKSASFLKIQLTVTVHLFSNTELFTEHLFLFVLDDPSW